MTVAPILFGLAMQVGRCAGHQRGAEVRAHVARLADEEVFLEVVQPGDEIEPSAEQLVDGRDQLQFMRLAVGLVRAGARYQVARHVDRVGLVLLVLPAAQAAQQPHRIAAREVPGQVAHDAPLLVVDVADDALVALAVERVVEVRRVAGEDQVEARAGCSRQGVGVDLVLDRAVTADLRVVDLDRPGHAVGDVPLHRGACGPGVALAKRLAIEAVLGPAVDRVVQAGQAERQALTDGHVQHRGVALLAVVARLHLDVGAEFILRVRRAEQDAAHGGVAPEQRALRATQHLDAGHVVERREQRTGTWHVHAVDEGADARVDAAVARGADAADGESHVRRLRAARDRHVGDEALQVEHARDTGGLQCLTAECRDGQRHVLCAFDALLRGDDDFFHFGRSGGRPLLGTGRRGRRQGHGDGRRHSRQIHVTHAGSPNLCQTWSF